MQKSGPEALRLGTQLDRYIFSPSLISSQLCLKRSLASIAVHKSKTELSEYQVPTGRTTCRTQWKRCRLSFSFFIHKHCNWAGRKITIIYLLNSKRQTNYSKTVFWGHRWLPPLDTESLRRLTLRHHQVRIHQRMSISLLLICLLSRYPLHKNYNNLLKNDAVHVCVQHGWWCD
jgi:hypothetical protein